MEARKPSAPHFYAGDCARMADRFLQGFVAPPEPARVVAGIVPHAGLQYSGAVAAKVFASISAKARPTTFVIFRPLHPSPPLTSLLLPRGQGHPKRGPAQEHGGALEVPPHGTAP